MRIYTVFTPTQIAEGGPGAGGDPGAGSNPTADAEAVKEGFCWPAFMLSIFWALWHRLWLAALIFFAANLGLGAALALSGADPLTSAAASLGLAAIIGWTANDLRRAKLSAQGFAERAPVIAATGEAAIRRYFEAVPTSLPGAPA